MSNKEILNIDKSVFAKLYGKNEEELSKQILRYKKLYINFKEKFGEAEKATCFVSAPGRSELSGNHTDHNGGKVIAASINLDTVACVAPQNDKIEIYSDGFSEKFLVELNELEVKPEEKETSNALIRGIVKGFILHNKKIGGFKATITSDVLQGSGLSSSAAFEVLIGAILSTLYNNSTVSPTEIAQIGQYSENEYFGKPCGLMDQVACATGGIVAIDFHDSLNPKVTKIKFDLNEYDYKLLVVNTGGSHANLTDEYSAIPLEMKSIANYFGKEILREIDFESFLSKLPKLKVNYSHRAILRAFHFFTENDRVDSQTEALNKNDLKYFLSLVRKSGNSSYKFLQNINVANDSSNQPLALALVLSEKFIADIGEGACRVHGGGFAGTIQIFLPSKFVKEYVKLISEIFGENSVSVLSIRLQGLAKIEIKED